MLLTEKQLQAIKQLIADHHDAFIVNVIGPEAVAADVLEKLKAKGLVSPTISTIEDAYLYGQVLAALDNPKTAKMDLKEFKQFVAKNPVPLSPVEKQAVLMAKLQAAQYVKGLGNKVDLDTGHVLIEADAALRAETEEAIQDATAENIAKRESLKKLKSDLGWKAKDWTRDWDRIATTEKTDAMQNGVADNIKKTHGPDSLVCKRPMPDACEHCKDLHIGPDGAPRIFPLTVLYANGSNHGRKANDWKATVGPVHPHCQCQLVRIPAGWGFDKDGDLVPGGKLGVKYAGSEDLELSLRRENDLRKSLEIADHLEFQGLPISIENKVGSERHWKDGQGGTGTTKMLFAYGFIDGTLGADGDALDCFIGPDANAEMAFVIEQQNPQNGIYDEMKVMLGFSNEDDARDAYDAHYTRPDFRVNINPMDMGAFKRWLSAGGGDMGQWSKSETSKGPRLVILEKAQVSGEEAMADVTHGANDHAPSYSGTTGVNILMNVPDRPKPKTLEDWGHELNPDKLLRREEEERKAITRDPAVYDMIEPSPRVPVALGLDYKTEHTGSPIGTGLAERNQEWLEQAEKQLQGEPNRAPTVQKSRKPPRTPVPERKPNPTLTLEKALKGESASSHKYTSRKWMQDHWVYTYAEHHEGKVEGHGSDPEKVMLKVPVAKLGKLKEFKAKHQLVGQVFQGGKYAMMEVTHAEADALRAKFNPALAKKPTPPPPAPAKPEAPVKAVQKVGVEDHELTEKLPLEKVEHETARKTLDRPTLPQKPHLMAGAKVTVGGKAATLVGFQNDPGIAEDVNDDAKAKGLKPGPLSWSMVPDRAVVRYENGKRETVEWGKVTPVEEATYRGPYDRLGSQARVVKLHPEAQALMDKALEQEPLKGQSYKLFQNAIREMGSECFLVGGMVRDLIAGKAGGNSDDDILKKMADIDIVTTLSPRGLEVLAKKMNPTTGKPGAPHMMANRSFRWGMLGLKDKDPKNPTAPHGIDLDIAIAKQEQPYWSDPTFDHDLQPDAYQRDFTVNALYYDTHNRVVVDPTGQGLLDAQNNVLRLAARTKKEQHENPSLPWRYIKFRSRGMKPHADTAKAIREQFIEQIVPGGWNAASGKPVPPLSGKELYDQLARQFFYKEPSKYPPKKVLKMVKDTFYADGMGDLYDKHVAPLEEAVKQRFQSDFPGVS